MLLIVASFACTSELVCQNRVGWSPQILFAKTAFFDNQTGSDAVGIGALNALKKWGRFKILSDRTQANIAFELSGDPTWAAPIRYAYLNVVDLKTGENLWKGQHVWGGLLTGFNSVGKSLVNDLENKIKKSGR